jgi:pSer/pThr/pTyr-binding forkhead associated (FHA) protein
MGLSTTASVQGRRRLADGDTLRFGETLAVFRNRELGDDEDSDTVAASEPLDAAALSGSQRKVLLAPCRPLKGAGAFATPASNQQTAVSVRDRSRARAPSLNGRQTDDTGS